MVNCLDYLKNLNYNLEGYSQDTYYYLLNSSSEEEECEALLAFLEARFG